MIKDETRHADGTVGLANRARPSSLRRAMTPRLLSTGSAELHPDPAQPESANIG
jgi:hypothetical protein